MTDQESAEGQHSIGQPEGIGTNDLHALDRIIRPYFDGYYKSELEKAKLDTEFELQVMEKELKYRKLVMTGIFAGIFAVLVLAAYLFATERNDYAMDLIVGIVLVVMTFIAGHGVKASTRSKVIDE